MGLTGQTQRMSGTPKDVQPIRQELTDFLSDYGISKGLFPSVVPNAASLEPFLQLFTQQNARNFAQVKESAGNLTGSGFANQLGAEAGRASTEQGAFLANLMEQRRQKDQATFMQTLLGIGTSGVGPDQFAYKPGLLDYASQGVLGLAGGGAFNKILGAGGGGGGAASGIALPGNSPNYYG